MLGENLDRLNLSSESDRSMGCRVWDSKSLDRYRRFRSLDLRLGREGRPGLGGRVYSEAGSGPEVGACWICHQRMAMAMAIVPMPKVNKDPLPLAPEMATLTAPTSKMKLEMGSLR